MTTYVKKSDLEAFANELARRVPAMRSLKEKKVVDAVWRFVEDDLRRHVAQNGMGRVSAVSAESGYSLDGSSPAPPYIQREGVALDKAALARLPVDNNRRWPYSLFGHDEDVWSLFSLWVRYLRDSRSHW